MNYKLKMLAKRGNRSNLRFVLLQRTLWLNDRQPVKVLKSLNDRQSDIFLKFKESKEHIHSNYDMSIKNCQAILRSCLDRECNAWFTLGSESESMVCDNCVVTSISYQA